MATYGTLAAMNGGKLVTGSAVIDTDTYTAGNPLRGGPVRYDGSVTIDTRTYGSVEPIRAGAVRSDGSVVIDRRTYTAGSPVRAGPIVTGGVVIPTGEFRDVTVWVENSEGEPLTSATWIQSAGLFPTAARVKETSDGRAVARLWLLDASYQEFQVLAEGSENLGYVWYQTETDTDTPAIDRSDREATLRFNVSEPAGGDNPLSVGFGASIGGS